MSLSDSNKILVVGSGPDAPSWWVENGPAEGWHLMPINNVWKTEAYARRGVRLYNVGTSSIPTSLPFPRTSIKELSVA